MCSSGRALCAASFQSLLRDGGILHVEVFQVFPAGELRHRAIVDAVASFQAQFLDLVQRRQNSKPRPFMPNIRASARAGLSIPLWPARILPVSSFPDSARPAISGGAGAPLRSRYVSVGSMRSIDRGSC